MSGRRVSLIWVRINGQAEMRENVRRELKASPLTQRKAADLAGMKYTRLTAFLAEQTWWSREDLERITSVLLATGRKVTMEGLQGGSIFRDDPWSKLKAFQYRPDRGQETTDDPTSTDVEVGVEVRALCCTCGRLRKVDVINGDSPTDGEDELRWVLELQCLTCDRYTVHAVLRHGEHRDHAETVDHEPTNAEVAVAELQALVDRIAGFNVEVAFRPLPRYKAYKDKEPISIRYEFDESKSHWLIEVSPRLAPSTQLAILADVWRRIATDDHDGIDWDPKTGVICQVGDNEWKRATDELVEDIDRFLRVEQRRMVADINDDISTRGARPVQASEVDR